MSRHAVVLAALLISVLGASGCGGTPDSTGTAAPSASLTLKDNPELARLLVDEARAQSADHFAFAITEDCGTFDEYDAYTDAYADLCAAGAVPATANSRDLGLVAASAEGYEFERCAVSG